MSEGPAEIPPNPEDRHVGTGEPIVRIQEVEGKPGRWNWSFFGVEGKRVRKGTADVPDLDSAAAAVRKALPGVRILVLDPTTNQEVPLP